MVTNSDNFHSKKIRWQDLIDDIALTGDPTAPTAAEGDDDTSLATTAFVPRGC